MKKYGRWRTAYGNQCSMIGGRRTAIAHCAIAQVTSTNNLFFYYGLVIYSRNQSRDCQATRGALTISNAQSASNRSDTCVYRIWQRVKMPRRTPTTPIYM